MDYLGRYRINYSSIVLTGPGMKYRGIRKLFYKLTAEFTFYHEAGHHALGHLEYGQDEDQERAANHFARICYRNSHPIFTGIGRILLKPVVPIVRHQLRKSKAGRRFLRHNKTPSSGSDLP